MLHQMNLANLEVRALYSDHSWYNGKGTNALQSQKGTSVLKSCVKVGQVDQC